MIEREDEEGPDDGRRKCFKCILGQGYVKVAGLEVYFTGTRNGLEMENRRKGRIRWTEEGEKLMRPPHMPEAE